MSVSVCLSKEFKCKEARGGVRGGEGGSMKPPRRKEKGTMGDKEEVSERENVQ